MRYECGFMNCGKPAVDWMDVQYQITGDIGKLWLCAEHYDLLSVNPAALHDPDQHRSTP